MKRKWLARLPGLIGLAGWLAATGAREARAAQNPATLNINVTITQNLSVAVVASGVAQTTQTVNWNTGTPNDRLVNDGTGGRPSSMTVLNDSGGQTERWALSTNANSINAQGGAVSWARVGSTTSVGADQFAIQAVFGSSNTAVNGCLSSGHGDWNSGGATPLDTSLQTYGSGSPALFVGASLTNAGGTPNPDSSSPQPGEMYANSQRVLCWRVTTPATTSTSQTQNIQLIVTAQTP
ncbi:MAG: hypothetical protein HY551_07585 [Elusimicrobia bacterium]|nr:hypothetical protein [Elusimicrobiota bacterium]